MKRRPGTALIVVSGGRKFGVEHLFEQSGISVLPVSSHRIELTSTTLPGSHVDIMLLTSRNAVSAIATAGLRFLAPGSVFAVGPATGEALAALGVEVSASSVASTEGLLAELPADLSNRTVFWPRGSDADLRLETELERRGASVIAPVVYRKIPLEFPAGLTSEVRGRKFGAFACTSPAAAEWLFENLDPAERDVMRRIPAAVLGRSSEEALRKLGVESVEIAAHATFASLAKTVISIFDGQAGS